MKWNQFFEKANVEKSAWVSLPILALIVAGTVLFHSTGANSQTAPATLPCSLSTLNGSYGVIGDGFNTENPDEFFPLRIVGVVTFDGAGNNSGTAYANAPPGPVKFTTKGTYKVLPDCTGSITMENQHRPSSHFVIVHGGDEYFQVSNAKGRVFNLTGKRQ